MPPAAPDPPVAASLWSARLFALALALGAVGCFLGLARHALAMQFSHDDWEWLARGRHLPSLLAAQLSFRSEVFRPVPQDLFALSLALFGPRPLPLAVFFLGVHVLGGFQTVRLGVALGLSRWAGAFAALLVFFSRESAEAFDFFSLNQVILSRLLVVSVLVVLLREERPRWWRWLPLTLAALGTHEQSILAAPLFLLCLVYRDGAAALRRLRRQRARLAFLAVCASYALLRGALLDTARQGSHALGFGALRFKLGVFWEHCAGFLHTHFDTRDDWVLGSVLLAAVAFWCYRHPRRAPHTLALGAAWALLGYGPYFLAIRETSGYHFALALIGLALPTGALLAFWLFDPDVPLAVRGLLMPLALWSVLPVGSRPPLFLPKNLRASTQVVTLVRAALRATPPDRQPVHLVFIDDEWSGRGPPPFYLVQMSGEHDFNHPYPTQDNRNGALAVSFPERAFRVWVMSPSLLPFLCARPADIVLRVSRPGADPRVPRYGFQRLAPCVGPLPPGLAAGAPAALESPDGRALVLATTDYWRAYASGDHARALLAGTRALQLGAPTPQDRPDAPGRALTEPVAATMPARERPPPR